MEKKIIIPDAINANINNNYTMINNDILRDPTLSFKAKTLLCLLLSNQKGWKSYKTQIKKCTKEGKNAIDSGLNELEKNGYILRSQYRCKKTKIIKGSVISYTQIPFYIDPKKIIELLDKNGFELI